jgi:acylphosphatase
MSIETKKIIVSGQVQGVGYRAFAQAAAQRLDLRGFCRNLPDGRVEVLVEGPPDRVHELVEALRRGPLRARVEHLEITPVPNAGHATDFEIRY